MKFEFNMLVGIFGTIAIFLWGGFPFAIQVLIYFALADYVSGIYSAFIQKKLSSSVGFKGIFKKIFMFLICSLAYYIDTLTQAGGVLFNVVVFWYLGNEALSIIENAIKSGVKVPEKLKNAIVILMDNDDEEVQHGD